MTGCVSRLHLNYWSHMNLPFLVFFSSSTLSTQNLNLCVGGVTSWKHCNPHVSYRANAGDSARQSLFPQEAARVVCCWSVATAKTGYLSGRGSLPWFSCFPNNVFFSTQMNVVCWLKYLNKPGPVGWNMTAMQILTDKVTLQVTTLHLAAFGSFCNFPFCLRRCCVGRRTMWMSSQCHGTSWGKLQGEGAACGSEQLANGWKGHPLTSYVQIPTGKAAGDGP